MDDATQSHVRPQDAWMRTALDALWDELDREAARRLIGDADARAAFLRGVAERLPAGAPAPPVGSLGDNLFQALIALRVKFSREESLVKLMRNLAMRAEQRQDGQR